MKLKSSQLKAYARGHLTGKYVFPIVAYLITDMIMSTALMLATLLSDNTSLTGQLLMSGISLILSAISAIFIVGQNKICLHMIRSTQIPAISDIWYGFRHYADAIILMFFQIFGRCFLYGLSFVAAYTLYFFNPNTVNLATVIITLLITCIMSIIIELDYGLCYFLVLERPNKTASQILAESKQLMFGNRKRLFYLQLSFIGMHILRLLSFGFASMWVMPYIRMTLAEFYMDIVSPKTDEEPVTDNMDIPMESIPTDLTE